MTIPDQPLNPETLDELLSADLDGELGRAAPELGFTEQSARRAIAATPSASQRRDELLRARALLATRPPLAPERGLGLAAAALDRATQERRVGLHRSGRFRSQTVRRVLTGAAAASAIAAAIFVVALIGSGNGSKSESASSVPPPTRFPDASKAPTTSRSIEFGDITQPAALLTRVEAQLSRDRFRAPRADAAASGGAGAVGITFGATGTFGPIYGESPSGPTGPAGVTGSIVPGEDHTGAGTKAVVPNLINGVPQLLGPQGLLRPNAPGGPGLGAIGSRPAPVGRTGTQTSRGEANGTASPLSGVAASGPVVGPTEPECTIAAEHAEGLRSEPILFGSGTDRGARVFVVVIPKAGSYLVLVLSAGDCSLIRRLAAP